MSASSVSISFKAVGSADYLANVTDLVVGNMVDPVTGQYWFDPAPSNPWVWNNDGSNAKAFGLMANYKYNGEEKTAFSKVVIDPTKMAEGDFTVEVTLCTCAIDGKTGNPILRIQSATVNGVENDEQAYVNDWGTDKPQPSCDFN